jgi:hypothetical protein
MSSIQRPSLERTQSRNANTEPIKAPCSQCVATTTHKVLHSVSRHDTSISNDWYGLIECAGCGKISMAHQAVWTTNGDVTNTYYPAPMSRKLPIWAVMLGERGIIGELLEEVHKAAQGDMRRLAAMGIRSLLEHVMISKVGDQGSFATHLDAFQRGGYISLIQKDALRAILDAGDAATHRSFLPSMEEINTALDVVEGVLAAIYDHMERAKQLANRVPPRPKKATPKTPRP